jgi:arylformamidase
LEVSENLVRQALAISGLFELSPLIQTSVNESLRLDDATAAAASPAFWPPPHGAAVEAWVGASESSEYFRQAKLLADRWEPSGARVHVGVLHGLNHFTAPNPLGDPESELTGSLLRLARAGAATHAI